jgi:hypothetical protein
MKSAIWLRVAAGLAFLHGVLHTMGGVFGGASPGPQQTALLAMKSNTFPAMGMTRSYWDFFLGSGLFISINFFLQAVLFWQLAGMAKKNAPEMRSIAALFAIGYLGFAFLAWRYFFPVPAVMELLIAGCLTAAFVSGRRAPAL